MQTVFQGEIVAALPGPLPAALLRSLQTSHLQLCLLLVPPGFVLTCLIYTNTKDCPPRL